jgi:glycosyl transferase family 2
MCLKSLLLDLARQRQDKTIRLYIYCWICQQCLWHLAIHQRRPVVDQYRDMPDRRVQSALAQTHADREILVIDDGSSDHTDAVASKYGQAIRYLRQENKAKPPRSISASSPRKAIQSLFDDDDLFPRLTLAKHAEALAENSSADFSYGRYARFNTSEWPSASELRDVEYVPSHDPRRLVVKLMERCFLPNPTWGSKRGSGRIV